MSSQSLKDLWRVYLRAYAHVEAGERAALLEKSVAEGVTFTNPGGEGRTRQGLITHIDMFQDKMPGAYFSTDQLYEHHGELLAVWSMHEPSGARIAKGYSFVQSDDDGRFRHIAGFFDQP